MDFRGQLTSIEDVNTFMNAGHATITLVSKRTGDRRTFKISEAKDNPNLFFVALLAGPDNENDYQYLGTIRDLEYRRGKKSRMGPDSPAHVAFDWFFRNLRQNNAGMFNQLEVWHEGRCGRCGRKLTVPASVARGFGPECAGHV